MPSLNAEEKNFFICEPVYKSEQTGFAKFFPVYHHCIILINPIKPLNDYLLFIIIYYLKKQLRFPCFFGSFPVLWKAFNLSPFAFGCRRLSHEFWMDKEKYFSSPT
jgi:hypothetical protein